eukprot:IDg13282t1
MATPVRKNRCAPLAPRPILAVVRTAPMLLPRPSPSTVHVAAMNPPAESAASAHEATPVQIPILSASVDTASPAASAGASTVASTPTVSDANNAPRPTPATPSRRQFTRGDDETLVDLWRAHIGPYFHSVRRRVLDKMTAELNDKLDAPPYFNAKQVANKLSYMERRYRAIREDFSRQKMSFDSDVTQSLRATIERRFNLFYPVHDLLRNIIDTGAVSPTLIKANILP